MSLFEVGRLCVKIAGRDAGRKGVVVEKINDTFVLVDGDVRRKKVNMKHLEPLAETIEIREKATHDDVAAVFKRLGLLIWETKPKQAQPRPKKQKKVKKKEAPKKEKKVEELKEEIKAQEEQVKAEAITGETSPEQIKEEKEFIKEEKEEVKEAVEEKK